METTSFEVIKKAISMAMKPNKSLFEKGRCSSEILFSFPPASWSANEWFANQNSFGETKINRNLFPSLRRIGRNKDAIVNEAFLKRFQFILANSSLQNEVEKAMKEKKQIVFTGHSSGGAIAILTTIWFLEKYSKPDSNLILPLCVTFGSPLVGDSTFNHALSRENWTQHFIHFVMKYDIVPRIMLVPRSSFGGELDKSLSLLNPKSTLVLHDDSRIEATTTFFLTVMRNTASVASYAACQVKGNTNTIVETFSSFAQLSPYRPFGTFNFCVGNGKLVTVKNPDAVLQILFYSYQLSSEGEGAYVAHRSIKDHQSYDTELQKNLTINNLNDLDRVSLHSEGADHDTTFLNDLGLSTRARLCIRATGEIEKQKLINQEKIDRKINDVIKALQALEAYKAKCETHKTSYYDAFKTSRDRDDFNANIKRYELTGIMDEIVEMLNKQELPDGFEGRKKWIEIGTKYRRVVEPLDIANYYRHQLNEDTGPYLPKGRPKRYEYTQRWLEHAEKRANAFISESCFLAEVEELSRMQASFVEVKDRIVFLETEMKRWIEGGGIGKDVFMGESTFVQWWKTLPDHHKSVSCIPQLMGG